MNKVAYVILGWNNKDLLNECFQSIYEQTYANGWIIYVDNGSSDGSIGYVKENHPKVTIIDAGYNTGFAKGNNIGIARALENGDVESVVLLNTDARIAPEWTNQMVDFARLKPKGAIFQGTTLDYYNHNIIDSTHIFIARNGQGTQGSWRNFYTADSGPRRIFGANAAACLITRKFLDAQPFGREVFDEQFFIYLEDVDLSTRATIMGWSNYLVPKARAYHMGSASSGKIPGYSLYMTFRNNSAVLVKNLPLKLIIRMLPMLIRGDIDTIITLHRTNKGQAIKKVIKGRVVGTARAILYLNKRRRLMKSRDIDTEALWALMDKGY